MLKAISLAVKVEGGTVSFLANTLQRLTNPGGISGITQAHGISPEWCSVRRDFNGSPYVRGDAFRPAPFFGMMVNSR